MHRRVVVLLGISLSLAACLAAPTAPPTPAAPPAATLDPGKINLDIATQTLIASANRVAFIVPFSHWDTDWHDSFANYSKLSDGNILNAIHLAQQDSRYRFNFEQVRFVQHFWDSYPDQRETLKHFVQNRQFTFSWTGITQPETSLVAPATQVRNLQLGRQWIADTFGPEYISSTAWQSDAFGNSAAFPTFLTANNITGLFIGRWQNRCDPDYQQCQPLPAAFYWQSPATDARVLVSYSSYPAAWDAIHRLTTEAEQLKALHTYIDQEFARTTGKFVFIPMGSDFVDPIPNLMSLVDKWNAADPQTKLVLADPSTAFTYLQTQNIPTQSVDLNPIWQAFYATRPIAKITDKESDFYLTAADKFGEIVHQQLPAQPAITDPLMTAWNLAAMDAHYDNISAVSFDNIWNGSQWPRYQQTLQDSSAALAATLAQIASGIDAPLTVFNATSWPRSEVVEISAPSTLPGVPAGQALADNNRAILVSAAPGLGWTADSANFNQPPAHAATLTQTGDLTTLSNGLVSATLDAAHGGAMTQLATGNNSNLITAPSDDLTFWQDTGDVYGATFKSLIARESDAPAKVEVLAKGPLLARAQITFTLNGQAVTKLITVRADSALVEVTLTFAITPNTAAVVQTHTTLTATTRTDDLGFTTFNHPIDNTLLAPGDRTYRREIFYPITFFSDVSDSGNGLALITHGLQGLGGTSQLNLLLSRDARQDTEGLTDTDPHTFHYAYLPHAAPVPNLPQLAYAFNQPLIPVFKTGSQITVQLPFTTARQLPLAATAPKFATTYSYASSESALVLDLYAIAGQLQASVLNYNPGDSSVTLKFGEQTVTFPAKPLSMVPIQSK